MVVNKARQGRREELDAGAGHRTVLDDSIDLSRPEPPAVIDLRTAAERAAAGQSKARLEHLKQWLFAAAYASLAAIAGGLSLLAAYYLRHGAAFCGPEACGVADPYLALLPAAVMIRGAIALTRRPWRVRRIRGFFEEIHDALSDALIGSAVIVMFTFFFRSGFEFRTFSYARSVFVIDLLIASVLLIGVSILAKVVLQRLRADGHNQRNVVLIASDGSERAFKDMVRKHPELGYNIVGIVDHRTGDAPEDLQAEIILLAAEMRLHEVIVTAPGMDHLQLSGIVSAAELADLELKAVPDTFGLPPTKVRLHTVGNSPMLQLLEEPLPGGRRAVKRTMDLVIGGITLLVFTPVFIAIAIAVKLTSKGPVFFRQRRVGMDGRPFDMLKFRTMYVGSHAKSQEHEAYVAALIRGEMEEGGDSVMKMQDDPRITRIGRTLRRYSLDELPQLINVIRGEMSLVGPRPALPYEVAIYADAHRRRLEIRPGVTGLWQVSGRSTVTFQRMVEMDIEYIERWNPLLDCWILARTVPALIRNETG